MKTRSNLHTHTKYCDGRNTMDEMVQKAISLGFRSLGFSSHYYTGFPFDVCGIKKHSIDRYFEEIDALKLKYEGRIKLFKGFEIEYLKPYIDPRLDYSIGSIHLFQTPRGLREIDNTPAIFRSAIRACNGDAMALMEGYYSDVVSYARTSSYDILGHFDLVTKFNEKTPLFSEEDPRYIDLALSAIDEISKTGKIIEVNTGAISRGYRTAPYPAVFILRRILEKRIPVTISSDCHDAVFLDRNFEETEGLLRSLGFTEQAELTDTGFQMVSLL